MFPRVMRSCHASGGHFDESLHRRWRIAVARAFPNRLLLSDLQPRLRSLVLGRLRRRSPTLRALRQLRQFHRPLRRRFRLQYQLPVGPLPGQRPWAVRHAPRRPGLLRRRLLLKRLFRAHLRTDLRPHVRSHLCSAVRTGLRRAGLRRSELYQLRTRLDDGSRRHAALAHLHARLQRQLPPFAGPSRTLRRLQLRQALNRRASLRPSASKLPNFRSRRIARSGGCGRFPVENRREFCTASAR